MEVTSKQSQTGQYSLQKSGLRITDSGTWKCKIELQFLPGNLEIPFDVKVIGRKNPGLLDSSSPHTQTLGWASPPVHYLSPEHLEQ